MNKVLKAIDWMIESALEKAMAAAPAPTSSIGPTMSSVHVNSPDWSDDEIKKSPELELIAQSMEVEEAYDVNELYEMQDLVEGLDWELSENDMNEEIALDNAEMNLRKDPDHYKKLWAKELSTSDELAKDLTGLRLDLGSGPCRAPGYVGYDLYPHDRGTVVHDLTIGIPCPDQAATAVRMVNSLAYMDGMDRKKLWGEIARVLQDGGGFYYEGPEELTGLPPEFEEVGKDDNEHDAEKPWYKQAFNRVVPDPATANDSYPRLNADDYVPGTNALGSIMQGNSLDYYDDIDATSQTAANRNYGYASQGALAKDDTNYDEQTDLAITAALGGTEIHEDKPSKRRVASVALMHDGKLLMGKRRDNGKWTIPGGHADDGEEMHAAGLRELSEETGIQVDKLDPLTDLTDVSQAKDESLKVQGFKHELNEKPSTSMLNDPDGEVYRWRWVDLTNGLPREISENLHVPLDRNIVLSKVLEQKKIGKKLDKKEDKKLVVRKLDKARQLVYGVVLTPDEVDSQDDYMTADDIEKAAHFYMENSRTVGAGHEKPIKAVVVESYISPCEWTTDTPYGPQIVKKGAWVLCVKVLDKAEWSKVVDGEYQAFSVGGFGVRA